MQNKVGPVLFFFIFVGVFFLFGLNNYETPVIFWGQDTEIVKGTVTEVTPIIRGRGSYQDVKFTFLVSNTLVKGRFKAGKRQGIQMVGDHLSVEYLVNDPSKSKVIGFYRKVNKKRN